MSDFFELSHDEKYELYKQNPDRFSEIASKAIEDWIDKVERSEEQKLKLRQLQFRIQRDLRGYKNPILRMNKMVEMFWEGVYKFKESMEELKVIDSSVLSVAKDLVKETKEEINKHDDT